MQMKKKDRFVLVGNGKVFRDEKDMMLLDREQADNAFKKYKKEVLDVIMAEHGFLKWKTKAYVRLNPIGLLEYMDLQKERYGSKTFCVNFAVMPLYAPLDYIDMGLGNRLGHYISGKDFWWDYVDDETAKASFVNVAEAVKLYLLPWLEHFSDEENYRQRLLQDQSKSFIGYPNQAWLEALDSQEKEAVMEENISRLKLPGKILTKIK